LEKGPHILVPMILPLEAKEEWANNNLVQLGELL
jgi:hypothetical protein